MGARFRLTAGALVMGAALCTGAAAGRVVGPTAPRAAHPRSLAPPASDAAEARAGDAADPHAAHRAGPSSAGNEGASAGPAGATEGLLATAAGYTMAPEATLGDGLPGTPFRFRITDPAGVVVRDYALVHERPLHLVVVARDLAVYHHLHPVLDPDGTWVVPLPALTPGAYRAFADFTVAGGPALVLGADLFVPGGALYSPLPPPTGLVDVHGYEVSLTGAPALGEGGEVALTVAGGGVPVTDLEPYLGAYGHLIVIRSSDLAFVHAHPVPAGDGAGDGAGAGAGPTVRFHVAVSAPGDYRMFFEFAHAGVVHVAPFTVHVPPPPP
jgi:hypothetical protein